MSGEVNGGKKRRRIFDDPHIQDGSGGAGYSWKWKPNDICDLDHNESWFSSMAEQGLFLDHVGQWRVCFKEGPPRKVRYRMDVLSRKLTEDELAVYDSCGWHYVTVDRPTRRQWIYVFQTDENATVPELHTDPLEQAESLRVLHRQSVFDAAVIIGYLVLFICVGFWDLRTGTAMQAFRAQIRGSTLLLLGIIYLCALPLSIYRWGMVRRLRKRLSGGEALDHRADYRDAHRRFTAFALLYLIASAAVVVLLLAVCIKIDPGQRPLEQERIDFPLIRLAEAAELLDGRTAEGEPMEERWMHDWTSAGVTTDSVTERASTSAGTISLYTECYRLPPWKQSGRILELMTARYEDYLTGLTAIDTDLVERAYTGMLETEWKLFVMDGRYVMEITYYETGRVPSDVDMALLLPLLAQRLEQLK